MNKKKMPFKKTNILLPHQVCLTKWSVIACDQYTSEPRYWQKVQAIINKAPSTYNLILPEIFFNQADVTKRIKKINQTMKDYLNHNQFDEYQDTMIYLQRTQTDGNVREGLIGMIDLEDYSYQTDAKTLIRATEKTVLEKIPPRVRIRKDAELELPHIIILIDDETKTIIESLKNEVKPQDLVYDFDLMQDGGHLKGYKLNKNLITKVTQNLTKLTSKNYFAQKYKVPAQNVLSFVVGDGNHSLATAKKHYENLKKTMTKTDYLNHPARYALVELVNLHSPAIKFEPIYRVILNIDVKEFMQSLDQYYKISTIGNGQWIELITKDFNKKLYLTNPKSDLTIESLQLFLDAYLQNHKGTIEYIHGTKMVRKMSQKEGNIGILFETIPKEQLFKTIILSGPLPQKSFSMGTSSDKRYYLEARKIK